MPKITSDEATKANRRDWGRIGHSSGVVVWGLLALSVITYHAVTPTNTTTTMMQNAYSRLLEEVKAHKDLFPLDSSDYWGTFFVFLGLMVAASGGVGGGGILVPLFILVYKFQPKYAVAMSDESDQKAPARG
jgi:hypothetical protein